MKLKDHSFKSFLLFSTVAGSFFSSLAFSANVTAQMINQDPTNFMGKEVTLTAQVNRVLGPGAYIVNDKENAKNPNDRILVLTAPSKQQGSQNPKSLAQPVQLVKEGEEIRVNGKVEQLSISSETARFLPHQVETIQEAAMTLPVVIVHSENVKKSG